MTDTANPEFLIDEQTDKFRILEENERVTAAGRRTSGTGPAAAARHHDATPPNPSGPGWREVVINGDTRFDMELV